MRTTLLSLKLAEIEWMKARTGQWPVLLLDEVMVELDKQRRSDLLAALNSVEQAMLTTTDLHSFRRFLWKNPKSGRFNYGTVRKKLLAEG